MDRLVKGVRYFIIGLAQKVLVANTVATAADQVFDLPPGQVETSAVWLGAVCYMVQIYFDFGGYTNMAIGLGHMIGFSLPQNFDHPYLAQSMTDFWRRWHMTLSRWFRDYLYIPLGGNRYGALRTYRNLLITFLLCGLWHGAAWTFAIWGLYHGLFLILERRFSHRSLPSLLRPLRHAYVLLAVLFGWVIFRSDSLAHAFRMSQTMVGFGHQAPTAWPIDRFATRSVMAALLAAALITVAPLRHSAFGTRDFAGWMGLARNGLTVASLLVLFCLSAISLSSGTYNPFIYFRF
jgi:alginate O-acetyltransferase complex protein AlgI